jgi:hypothetical protein
VAQTFVCGSLFSSLLGLQKDMPDPRAIQSPDAGRMVAIPEVGGLHHRYQEETDTGTIIDPWGGSYFVERLTHAGASGLDSRL